MSRTQKANLMKEMHQSTESMKELRIKVLQEKEQLLKLKESLPLLHSRIRSVLPEPLKLKDAREIMKELKDTFD